MRLRPVSSSVPRLLTVWTFSIYNGLDFNIPARELDRKAEVLWANGANGDVVCGIAARLDPVKHISTLSVPLCTHHSI